MANLNALGPRQALARSDRRRQQNTTRGEARALGPTIPMRIGGFLNPMLERVLDIFPKDNPYGSFLERLAVGSSPEKTRAMGEGYPHQYTGAGPNDPLINPEIVDLLAAVPAGSALKAATSVAPFLKAAAVPAGMLAASQALRPIAKGERAADDMSGLLGAYLQRQGAFDDAMAVFDDLPISQMGESAGLPRTKPPVHRKVETTGRIIGAPTGVDSPSKLRRARNKYMELVKEGQSGRRWYEEASDWIGDVGGERYRNPFAAGLARTSSGTAVDANLGHAIKAHQQIVAGAPRSFGRFPGLMRRGVERAYEEAPNVITNFGPKLDPYFENLQRSWADKEGAAVVNDIWQGRAFGYKRPDGGPWDSGFSQQQHDFMTAETIYAAERANELKIGGHTDWTPSRIQASAWTGQRIRSGEVPVERAAETYPDIAAKYAGFGTRETTPGAAAGHLKGLQDLPLDVQEEISKRYLDVLAPEGRDVITRMTGALPGGDITRGPGYWEGASTPAYNAPMLVGREVTELPTAGRQMAQIDPASRQQMNVSEATYALLTAQELGAWNVRVLQKTPLSTHNAIDISLGRVPTREETLQLGRHMNERYGEDVAVTFTDDGHRLLNVEQDPDTSALKQWATETRKDLAGQFGKDKIDSGYASLGAIGDDWSSEAGRYGGDYLKTLRGQNPNVPIVSPELVAEGFDSIAPGLAKQLNDLDEWVQKTHGLNISPDIKKVRQAIVKDGIKGLQKLVDTGVLPALLVVALTPYLEAGLSSPP